MAADGDRRERLVRLLRDRGLRATVPRRAILAHLLGRQDHPTAREVFTALQRTGRPVSVATLYQNLEALSARKLLRRFVGPEGVVRYDVNLQPHHHLLCERCGRLADVLPGDIRGLRTLRLQAPRMRAWRVRRLAIQFQGLCPACASGASGGRGGSRRTSTASRRPSVST